MNRLLIVAVLVFFWLMPTQVKAQTCAASASPLNFGLVSPIQQNAVTTSGSVTVTCTWNPVTVVPNVLVCLNLGSGSGPSGINPRTLVNGANRMQFNIYQNSAYSQIWGSTYYSGGVPISFTLSKPALARTATRTVNFYGRIDPNQPTVPSVGNANTLYSSSFSGNEAVVNTNFYALIPSSCANATATSTFPFIAAATVVNDCIITTTNVNFAAAGVLNKALTATGGLTVRCTNSDAYRISLSGGNSGNVGARRMQRSGGGGSVAYQLYTDSARSIIWGDGTAGTSMVQGTGTGNAQLLTIYATVPVQPTPAPGTYSDTITATINF